MFAVVGLSHHTAPIQVRERMALERDQIEVLLKQLVAQPEIEEALVLSTCNRVEVMACAAAGVEPERLERAVRSQLSAIAEALATFKRSATDAEHGLPDRRCEEKEACI